MQFWKMTISEDTGVIWQLACWPFIWITSSLTAEAGGAVGQGSNCCQGFGLLRHDILQQDKPLGALWVYLVETIVEFIQQPTFSPLKNFKYTNIHHKQQWSYIIYEKYTHSWNLTWYLFRTWGVGALFAILTGELSVNMESPHTKSVQKVSRHVMWKIETFIEEDTRYKKHCT